MYREPATPSGEKEKVPAPTMEALRACENGFELNFDLSDRPILLWLGDTMSGRHSSMQNLKDYLQAQNLPTTEELKETDVSEWRNLYDEKQHAFRKTADKAKTDREKAEVQRIMKEWRVMQGKQPPETPEERSLPRFKRMESTAWNFAAGEQVPEPCQYTYRINIPDAPGELRGDVMNGIIRKFWEEPLFRKHGFSTKIIGFAKTDGLILYLGDETINAGLKIVSADALERGYGQGEPARFAQRIDERIPGVTVTTNPKKENGESAGTFGDVIAELLDTSLSEAMKSSSVKPEKLAKGLLEYGAGPWSDKFLQPIFTAHARELFGKNLNMHNLAFIDKG